MGHQQNTRPVLSQTPATLYVELFGLSDRDRLRQIFSISAGQRSIPQGQLARRFQLLQWPHPGAKFSLGMGDR